MFKRSEQFLFKSFPLPLFTWTIYTNKRVIFNWDCLFNVAQLLFICCFVVTVGWYFLSIWYIQQQSSNTKIYCILYSTLLDCAVYYTNFRKEIIASRDTLYIYITVLFRIDKTNKLFMFELNWLFVYINYQNRYQQKKFKQQQQQQ